jgi:hypothetical protein
VNFHILECVIESHYERTVFYRKHLSTLLFKILDLSVLKRYIMCTVD